LIVSASASATDIPIPLRTPAAATGTGYWVPTTYADHAGKDRVDSSQYAIDFYFADPQSASAVGWNQDAGPTDREAVAPYAGYVRSRRERLFCSGTERVATSLYLVEGGVQTSFTHLETIRTGDWVVVENTEPGGTGVNLRSCAGLACSVLLSMPNSTVMSVIGGPIRSDGYTWWNLHGSIGSGWAVESLGDAESRDHRQVLLSTRIRRDQIVRARSNVNRRSCAGTDCSIVGQLASGSFYEVTGGPQRVDGYTWWQLEGPGSTQGWSVEDLADPPLPPESADDVQQSDPTLEVAVAAGDRLGFIARYGCARFAHLHFQASVGGVASRFDELGSFTFDGEYALDSAAYDRFNGFNYVYEAIPRDGGGGDPCAAETELALWLPFSAVLDSGDCAANGFRIDYYAITVLEHGTLVISMDSNEVDSYVEVLAGDRSESLASSDGGGSGQNALLFLPVLAGEYVIAASSADTGNYEILALVVPEPTGALACVTALGCLVSVCRRSAAQRAANATTAPAISAPSTTNGA
jgi:hypothetical protein